jgi:hypothetical protein
VPLCWPGSHESNSRLRAKAMKHTGQNNRHKAGPTAPSSPSVSSAVPIDDQDTRTTRRQLESLDGPQPSHMYGMFPEAHSNRRLKPASRRRSAQKVRTRARPQTPPATGPKGNRRFSPDLSRRAPVCTSVQTGRPAHAPSRAAPVICRAEHKATTASDPRSMAARAMLIYFVQYVYVHTC